jgi:predicted metal-binding protein
VKAHLFVCTHTRENGESCGAKGSSGLVDRLKARFKGRYAKNEMRVNRSGCLGKCEQGIACVLYPEGEWRLGIQAEGPRAAEDELALISAVERLAEPAEVTAVSNTKQDS